MLVPRQRERERRETKRDLERNASPQSHCDKSCAIIARAHPVSATAASYIAKFFTIVARGAFHEIQMAPLRAKSRSSPARSA